MNTLVLYTTKNGFTKTIAERIAVELGGAIVVNLKVSAVPRLDEIGRIIVGSPVYGGVIDREIVKFTDAYSGELKARKLGLFLCGLDYIQAEVFFQGNFPADLLIAAKAKAMLGGSLDINKLGMTDKIKYRLLGKGPSLAPENKEGYVMEDRLKAFIQKMK